MPLADLQVDWGHFGMLIERIQRPHGCTKALDQTLGIGQGKPMSQEASTHKILGRRLNSFCPAERRTLAITAALEICP